MRLPYVEEFDEEFEEFIDEREIVSFCEDDFAYQIQSRGEEYYEEGKVLKCSKCGNKYMAKVEGSECEPYNVTIDVADYSVDYNCDCPYEFPCKHEFAVLLAIQNQEYEVVDLKPFVEKKKININEVIEKIPAEELNQYLLTQEGNSVITTHIKNFEEHFMKYLPKDDYQYYYNNLYNCLLLDDDYQCLVISYLDKIKHYISTEEFDEAYKIVKSIIEAYSDSCKLNNDDFIIDKFPLLGMYLRVIYRKGNKVLKNDMKNWISNLKQNIYYENYYLEDVILSIEK